MPGLVLNPAFIAALKRYQQEQADLEKARGEGRQLGRFMRQANERWRAAGLKPPYPELEESSGSSDDAQARIAELEAEVARLKERDNDDDDE